MSIARPASRRLDEEGAARSKAVCGYATIKPVVDLATALVLFILTMPVMVVSLLLVRLTSRGPALYFQRRMGLNGKVFTIYKIRTMYQDSERHSGATWCQPQDPRVTPLGRFLRVTHLDELPQLVNVLTGEMSLVGPRPERPEFLSNLERALPDYRQRLTVRPGITGLAQVQQPPDTDLFSVRGKLNYDLHYIESMGFWLDARIVLATGLKCAGFPYAWTRALLLLPVPGASPEREPLLYEAELVSKSLV